MLRKKSEPKEVELIGKLRKSQNKELHNLYSLPDIVRVIMSNPIR